MVIAAGTPRAAGTRQRYGPGAAGLGDPSPHLQFALMFWFMRKKFVGSYFFLMSTSRWYVAP